MKHLITLHVELDTEEAWALAQLMKRIGWSECRALAQDVHESGLMIEAIERVRAALAEAGCTPR